MELTQLAVLLGLEHRHGEATVEAIAPLESAGPGDLTYATERKHLTMAAQAAAVLAPPDLAAQLTRPCLVSATPALDLARAAKLLGMPCLSVPPGVHPSAVVEASAQLGEGVAIGPRVVIGAEVVIGAGTVIHAGAVIHDRTRIGARCVIHANAVIGAEGFGLEPTPQGLRTIPHFGVVRIEDEVEIGACTSVDRARFGETVIGHGSKIDNQVQIAHNVRIGRHCVIVAQVGIAGSCVIEDGAILAGQAGLAPHVRIGQGARIAAATGVPERAEVPAGATWSGWWGHNHRDNLSEINAVKRLPEFMKKVMAHLKGQGVEL